MIGLTGYTEDRPDDPYVIVTGAFLDHPVLPGPVTKGRREDLQVWAFLQTVTAIGFDHPFEVTAPPAGEDPPDRYLSAHGEKWATELT